MLTLLLQTKLICQEKNEKILSCLFFYEVTRTTPQTDREVLKTGEPCRPAIFMPRPLADSGVCIG